MKIRASLVASLIVINSLTLITVAQQGMAPSGPQSTHITGHGCLKAGTVSGCFVVNDYQAHRKYNVFFSQSAPTIDTGLSFEGIAYGHRDPHCNQGQRVDVAEWKPLASECPKHQNR